MRRENHHLLKRGRHWHASIMQAGKLRRVTLKTSDISIAKARRDELLADSFGGRIGLPEPVVDPGQTSTLGEVLRLYASSPLLLLSPTTIIGNARALRLLVREASGLDADAADKIPCSRLTRDLVSQWQSSRLARAPAGDRLAANRAAVSANSILLQARSVFGRRPVDALALYASLCIPDLRGFMAAPRLRTLPVTRYELPDADLLERIWTAARALRDSNPRLWVVWALAAGAGLRKNEIIHARWDWISGETLTVQAGADFTPKGRRARRIPMPLARGADLRAVSTANGWDSDTMLPGAITARADLFRELSSWLKSQGWPRRHAAHEFRKIYASRLIEAGTNCYAVQHILGHADMKTTERYAATPHVPCIDVLNSKSGDHP